MSQASFSVSALFVATTVAVASAFVLGAYYARKIGENEAEARAARSAKVALVAGVVIAAWLAISAVLASNGVLLHRGWGPPPLARLVLVLSVVTAVLAFSRTGGALVAALPLAAIVGFQAFRIPVEIVLAALHHEGLVPIQMTYEGLNYDILSGISAIVVAVLAARGTLPRWGLVTWNVLAMGLLLTIIAIANLSTPGPFQIFHDGPPSTVLVTAPFVWLPGFLVPAALFGHLLVFRLAFRRRRPSSASLSRASTSR